MIQEQTDQGHYRYFHRPYDDQQQHGAVWPDYMVFLRYDCDHIYYQLFMYIFLLIFILLDIPYI